MGTCEWSREKQLPFRLMDFDYLDLGYDFQPAKAVRGVIEVADCDEEAYVLIRVGRDAVMLAQYNGQVCLFVFRNAANSSELPLAADADAIIKLSKE